MSTSYYLRNVRREHDKGALRASELSRLQSLLAVQTAFDEFNKPGRTSFFLRCGFVKSRDVMVRNQASGELYDSKAIVLGVFGIQYPTEERPLKPADFSDGEAIANPKLKSLGFEVVRVGKTGRSKRGTPPCCLPSASEASSN